MAGERIDYTAAAVEAARSVLIELTHILGEYRDDMVLVGGWIPELLIPQSRERHVGSIDVDLALNHKELTEAGYRMIGEILLQHGYAQDKQQPFIFRKTVRGQAVQVDFLAGEYGGTGKRRRTQKALDMQPRKARGCDLAFQIEPARVSVKGKLPDGVMDEVHVQVASVVPFLVMKGMALEDRRKAKDAYDKVVNKALTINTGVDEFPRYVVEYLIDNYCSEETFHADMEKVVRRLRENFVHSAEAKRYGTTSARTGTTQSSPVWRPGWWRRRTNTGGRFRPSTRISSTFPRAS